MSKSIPKHICIRPVTLYDLQKCLDLEEACFPESERASRDKVAYRLKYCPELSSGLFIRTFEENKNKDDEYVLPNHSSVKEEKLIGLIMGTKCYDDRITERSMEIPKLTTEGLVDTSIPDNDKVGHVESASNIGIHSLIIHPDYRGQNLATLLFKDYLQKMSQQEVGSQIILIAHERLVPFYEKLGFNNLGRSQCRHGGESWIDFAIPIVHVNDD
ncbi:hypothetical protein LJB42_000493 [Komagataella kurtzmanii]|nr:hypothetical protein LJB42_000493 [Komagataella kurtzmanii]